MRVKIEWIFLTKLNSDVELEFFMKHFWSALIQVAKLIDIDLVKSIEFICIDAERASSNSISKMLNETKVIMCWYHLKANVRIFLQVN
jgi:hypothetical protein